MPDGATPPTPADQVEEGEVAAQEATGTDVPATAVAPGESSAPAAPTATPAGGPSPPRTEKPDEELAIDVGGAPVTPEGGNDDDEEEEGELPLDTEGVAAPEVAEEGEDDEPEVVTAQLIQDR